MADNSSIPLKQHSTYSSAESKRLGAAILKFLERHQNTKRLAPDQEEGIGVAMQCLSLVFDCTNEDAENLPDLMNIYNKEAGEMEKPKEAGEKEKKSAEEFKKAGNTFMKSKNYDKAIEKYSNAIGLDSQNEVYYCNRAAALTNISKFHEALDDCKSAIAINQDYAKAFSRMGLIYSKLNFFEESARCYKDAIKLEGDNQGYKTNLEIVEQKARDAAIAMAGMTEEQKMAAMGMQGAGASMPDANMADMMSAYQQMSANPDFANMAEKVMANPQMKEMVEGYFNKAGITPESVNNGGNAMENFASAMSNGGNMGDLMEMGKQMAEYMQKTDPKLIESLKAGMTGGKKTDNA